jgi:hypothetical protein
MVSGGPNCPTYDGNSFIPSAGRDISKLALAIQIAGATTATREGGYIAIGEQAVGATVLIGWRAKVFWFLL